MACALIVNPIHFARILAFWTMLSGPALPLEVLEESPNQLALVRVNIITETRGAKDTVEINGKLLNDYSPIIIQALCATGIVLDQRGHIMTFLGYRWVDIQNRDPRIEISTAEGKKWKGKLVGIDQSNGVAVMRLLGGKLKATPVCTQCSIEDGATIMAPVVEGPGPSEYQETQVLSVAANNGIPGQRIWEVAVNRPFPDVGQPILTRDHRVLGFVASQDPLGMRTVVYPISHLLTSAEKILKTGKDIPAGWLGIFLTDARSARGSGIWIRNLEPDSPAQKAGLAANDYVVKYNSQEIRDAREFIRLVQATPIGSKANLEILRRGRPMTVTAQVEARKFRQSPGILSFIVPGALGLPVMEPVTEPNPRGSHLLFGLETILLNPALADALRMPGQTGLFVTDVAENLPADRAGVLVGDVIVSIDGKPIVDAPGFASHMQTRNWDVQPVLKILRKGVERTIVVQIP